MPAPEVHRIMEHCLARNAQEVWLMAGRPPILREWGTLRELAVPPLLEEEITELAIESLAPQCRETYLNAELCPLTLPKLCSEKMTGRISFFDLGDG
jgi:Tfp pilus assembly pilus retraction ATPase PilT